MSNNITMMALVAAAVTEEERNRDALDAARYRKLRQQFKNNEVSLELWGLTFKDADTVCGEDDLDDFCDAAIAAEKKETQG